MMVVVVARLMSVNERSDMPAHDVTRVKKTGDANDYTK